MVRANELTRSRPVIRRARVRPALKGSLRSMTRPLRSLYFRGGHNEDDYVGCERSGADAIMIDLEEPCTPFSDAQRRRAREEVGQYLSARGTSEADPLYLVRIQSVSAGQAREDLEPIFCDALAGVMLPK